MTWPLIFQAKSKKARTLLWVLVLAIAAFLSWLALRPKSKPAPSNPVLGQNQIKEDLNRDSDNDGLKDWEEAIYHTDPHNPDTDGDGTPDGEEVKEGRDPLKPGPNDYIASSTAASASETPTGSSFSPYTNMTQRLAQLFGERYMARQLANPSDAVDPQAISQEILDNMPANEPDVAPLGPQDLTVSKNNSSDAIKNWAIDFDKIVSETFASRDQQEPMILITALQNENYGLLSQLDPYLKSYEDLNKKMKKLPVPSDFAKFQLGFMDAANQMEALVKQFRNAENDPVGALYGVENYYNRAQDLQTLNQLTRQELQKRNITFQ